MKHVLKIANQNKLAQILESARNKSYGSGPYSSRRRLTDDQTKAQINGRKNGIRPTASPDKRTGLFAVAHPDNPGIYLGNDFVRGGSERRWTSANPRIFTGQKDATKARDLKGLGEVVPASEIKLQANVLDSGLIHGLSLR